MWAISAVVSVLAFVTFGMEAMALALPALVLGEFAYVMFTGRDSDEVVESGVTRIIKQ